MTAEPEPLLRNLVAGPQGQFHLSLRGGGVRRRRSSLQVTQEIASPALRAGSQ